MDELMRGPGLVDGEDFGLPGPNIQYCTLLQKGWKKQARSDWLYYSKHPRKETKGLKPVVPQESQLPLVIRATDVVPSTPPLASLRPTLEVLRPGSPSGTISLGSSTPLTPQSIRMKSPNPPIPCSPREQAPTLS
jgi:hypothetical protein